MTVRSVLLNQASGASDLQLRGEETELRARGVWYVSYICIDRHNQGLPHSVDYTTFIYTLIINDVKNS